MSNESVLVLQGTSDAERTAYSVLMNAGRAERYDEAVFIAPFVTEQGARMLNEVARTSEVHELFWLVGLDGVITSPKALDALATSVTDAVQLGWQQDLNYPYLHAKVFALRRKHPRKTFLYIGSANATEGGLANNAEAGTVTVRDGSAAAKLDRELDKWLASLQSMPCCVVLTPQEKERYARRYRPPRGRGKRVVRIVGAEDRPQAAAVPQGARTWIEVAVRGGSGNQIEICKDMAVFFTEGLAVDRVDFGLVDAATGISYPDNAYRFRAGNVGYRVEVNTDLARALDLRAASERRDIIVFFRTGSPSVFRIELYPARSERARDLIMTGEAEGRVHETKRGPRGRRYYL